MIKELESIEFKGDVEKDTDISAIASFGDFLAIGSDESKRKIQILEKEENFYKFQPNLEIELPASAENEDQEIDIEGMSISNGDTLFIIGSHSLKRLKVKTKNSYLKNRERITRVIPEDRKNTIFKLTLEPQTGKLKKTEKIKIINIKAIIEHDSVLGIFTKIPSKENGVDIEGIASDGDTLYIGFRGPVLRDNYVPVMVIDEFKDPSDYELRFVDLQGSGIRELTKVKDGFLIIAGPVGDGLGIYQLYFWDGLDCIPGKDRQKKAQLKLLDEIPCPEKGKAEGITVMEETDSEYKVIIVYDGLPNGAATLLQVIKPAL